MSIQVSTSAFDQAIQSSLTNEIPHLSIYDILNKQIRMSWSRQLIGKSEVKYDSRTSTKMFEGVKSPNYTARVDTIVDPDTNRTYLVSRDKVDFSVSGFLETEIDYLMHENERYLGKLYPNDFNSLITLTEAERQSYFNEAGHMIHSYFDTEKIWDEEAASRLYLRHKFLTNITPIRKLTGIIDQEENLINLLNDGDFKVYSGYKIYTDEDGFEIFTTGDQTLGESSTEVNIYSYEFNDLEHINQTLISSTKCYILEGDDLSNFLENYSMLYALENLTLDNYMNAYYKVPNMENFVKDIIGGDENSINAWLKKYVKSRYLNQESTLETLLEETDLIEDLEYNLEDKTKHFFIKSIDTEEFVPIVNGSFSIQDICNIQGQYFINSYNLKDIQNTNLVAFGDVEFNPTFELAAGNAVITHFLQVLRSTDNFKDVCISCSKNNKTFLTFSLRRDAEESERVSDKKEMEELQKVVDTKLKEMEDAGIATFENPYKDLNGEVIYTEWMDFLNNENDNFTLIEFNDLSDSLLLAKDLVGAEKYRTAKKCLEYVFSKIDSEDYQKEIISGVFDKNFLEDFDYEQPYVNRLSYENYTINYSLLSIASNITKLENMKDIQFNVATNSHLKIESVITKTPVLLDEYYDRSTLERNKIMVSTRDDMDLFFAKKSYFEYDNSRSVNSQNYKIVNTVQIPIVFRENIYTLFKDNTYITTDEDFDESTGTYGWFNQYKMSSDDIKLETSAVDFVSNCELLFKKSSIQSKTLVSTKCTFVSDDTYRIEKDLSDSISLAGRTQCVIRDNYGKFHSGSIYKAWKEGDYFYLKDLYAKDLDKLENKEGLIFLKLAYEVSDEKAIPTAKIGSLENTERREIVSNKVYRNGQNFLIFKGWDTMSRENINYTVNNLYSKFPEVYNDASKISQNTKVPLNVYECSFATVLDIPNNTNERKEIIKELIKENKSLYIDSCLKLVNQVALQPDNLIFTEDYEDLSYMLVNGIPSQVSFYEKDNLDDYTPLKDTLDFIEKGKKDELTLEEIEDLYNRRKIIWGNVVWDANDNSRSVRALRTIWAGYFSNFEIYSSRDVIPSESDLLSLPGGISGTNLDILNYNYSYNKGNPDLKWEFAISANTLGSNSISKNGVDAFTHKPILEKEDKKEIEFDFITVNQFYLDMNVKDKNGISMVNIDAPIYYKDILSKRARNTSKFYFEIANDIEVKIDRDNRFYGVLDKEGVEFRLICNKFYSESDMASLGIFNSILGGHEQYSMILDYLTAKYFMESTGLEYYTVENLDNYIKEHKEELGSVFLGDVLAASVGDKKLNGSKAIHTLSIVKSNGMVDNYWMRVEEKDGDYYMICGSFEEHFTADFIASVTDGYTEFPVKPSQRSFFVESAFRNQAIIENLDQVRGYFLNTDLVLTSGLEKDEAGKYYYYVGEDGNRLGNHKITLDGKELENDSKEVTGYFEDLWSKKTTFNDNTKVLKINDFEYTLLENNKIFKEFYRATVSLSLGLEESLEKEEIDTHEITIETDLDFQNKGTMYFYDIKASNRRSSYSPERELLLIDRSHTLSDLRIDGFSVENNVIELKDNIRSFGKVEKAAETIKPIYSESKTQKINDDSLRVGKMWQQPDTEVGYTFYKRKFIFEGELSATDLTRLVPVDTKAFEDDYLTEHVSVGDNVEMILLDPPAVYTNSSGSAKVTTTYDLKGPFKKLYEDTISKKASMGSSDPESINRAIFSGRGILFVVSINLTKNFISVTTYNEAHASENISFFLVNEEYIYAKNLDTNVSWRFANLAEFLDEGKIDENKNSVKAIGSLVTLDGVEMGSDESYLKNLTNNTGLVTRGLMGTHEGEGYGNFDPSTGIVDTIGLANGTLYFTENDTIYFMPSGPGEFEFKDHPAKADMADVSGMYDSIIITENFVTQLKTISECTELQLKGWIKDKLQEYFYSFKEEVTPGVAPDAGNSYKIPGFQSVTDTPTSWNPNPTAEYEISTEVQGARRLAEILTKKTSGETVTFEEETIWVPHIDLVDTPVYTEIGKEPKWKKSYVLSQGNNLLRDADITQLQNFCRALLNTRYLTRGQQNVSTWAKSKNNIVAWDQGAATLTLMDASGKVIEKVANPYVGYEAQFSYKPNRDSNGNPTGDYVLKQGTAFTVPNTLFIKENANDVFSDAAQTYTDTSTGQSVTISGVKGKYLQSEWNNYSLFFGDGALNLYRLYQSNKLNGKYLNSLPKIKVNGKDFTFKHVLSDETKYNQYLKYRYYVDYMNASLCNYISLKDPDAWMSLRNIQGLLNGVTQDAAVTEKLNYLSVVGSAEPKEMYKGVPYISYEQYLNGNCDVLKEGSDALVSFNLDGNIFEFNSLIKESSLSVSDSNVKIYGTIEWPILGSESTPNSFLGRFKSQFESTYRNYLTDTAELNKFVSTKVEEVRTRIVENYKRFVTGEYEAGEKPFVLTFNIDSCSFMPVSLQKEPEAGDVVNAFIEDGDNFAAYTGNGKYDAGSGSQQVIQPEIDGPKLKEKDTKLLGVLTQMKTATSSVEVVENGAYGEIRMRLKGTVTQNPVVMHSKVTRVEEQEIYLEEFGLMLNEGVTQAIVLIEDHEKNNFQLGYGNITGFENISQLQSIFKVNRPTYADFVSYGNSFSSRNSSGVLPKVFDLYPTWENISEDRRSYFYKTDSKGEAKYLMNSFGQYLLRITDPESCGNYSGFIYKYGPTVAGETINLESKFSDTNFPSYMESVVFGPENVRKLSYLRFLKDHPKVQRVPELVDDPFMAIRSYAYKVASFEIDGSKDNYVEIKESYDENSQLTSSLDLHVTLKDPQGLRTFMTSDSNDTSLVDLDLRIENITETLPVYKKITEYAVSIGAEDTKIKSKDVDEIVIPEKGYGQALLGDYTTPKNNLFEDGLFYKQSHKTVNENGKAIRVKKFVTDDAGNVIDVQDVGEDLPALVYRSFRAADIALDKDLSTKEGPLNVIPFMLDLSSYRKEGNTLKFNYKDLYPKILKGKKENTYKDTHDLFLEGIKFNCKLIWSEALVDESCRDVADYSVIGFSGEDELFSKSELVNKLGYTREHYEDGLVANYEFYRDADKNLKFTTSSYSKNFNNRLCDSEGRLLGMSPEGELTRFPKENGFLHGLKNPRLVADESDTNFLSSFLINDGKDPSSSIYRIGEFLRISNKYFSVDFQGGKLVLDTNTKVKTFIFFRDPSTVNCNYQSLKNVTQTKSPEGESVSIWNKTENFRIKFNDLSMKFIYRKDFGNYNFAYLKDKQGNTVAKVYFNNKVNKDSLIVFSMT